LRATQAWRVDRRFFVCRVRSEYGADLNRDTR
jgi:hypothetical protein